jgi:hypothetical protein
VWEGRALSVLGWYAARLGDHLEAAAYCVAALELHRRLHDLGGEAATLDSLGYLAQRRGDSTRHSGTTNDPSRCAAKSAIPVSGPFS